MKEKAKKRAGDYIAGYQSTALKSVQKMFQQLKELDTEKKGVEVMTPDEDEEDESIKKIKEEILAHTQNCEQAQDLSSDIKSKKEWTKDDFLKMKNLTAKTRDILGSLTEVLNKRVTDIDQSIFKLELERQYCVQFKQVMKAYFEKQATDERKILGYYQGFDDSPRVSQPQEKEITFETNPDE